MPTTVDVPDFGSIDFPDEMSLDDITSALRKQFPPQAESGKWLIQDTLSRLGKNVAEQGGQAIQGIARGASIAAAQAIPANLRAIQMQAEMAGADTSPVAPLIAKAAKEAPAKALQVTPESPFYQFGRDIEETAKDFYRPDPQYDNSIRAKLTQGVASTVPVLASGPFAPITYAAMMGEQGAREAEEKGASPEKIADTFLANAALGMTSEFLLGVPYLLRSAKAIKGASAEVSKTALGKRLAALTAKHPVASLAVRGGIAEAIQEGPIEQVGQNSIAKFVGQYDTDRPIFKDVAEQAAYGAAIGLLLGGLFGGAAKFDRQRALAAHKDEFQDPATGEWLSADEYTARQPKAVSPETKIVTPFIQTVTPTAPQWALDELKSRGFDPDSMVFPLVDVQQKHIRDAIMVDPTLTLDQKANLIATGSVKIPLDGTEASDEVVKAKEWMKKSEAVKSTPTQEEQNAIALRQQMESAERERRRVAAQAPENFIDPTSPRPPVADYVEPDPTEKVVSAEDFQSAIISRGRFRPSPVSQITGRPQTVTSAPTVAQPAEPPVVGALKVGDEQTIMQVPSVLADTKTIGGVRWDLFNGARLKEDRAVVRVIDSESGEVLQLKQFPTYDAAETYYNTVTSKAQKMETAPVAKQSLTTETPVEFTPLTQGATLSSPSRGVYEINSPVAKIVGQTDGVYVRDLIDDSAGSIFIVEATNQKQGGGSSAFKDAIRYLQSIGKTKVVLQGIHSESGKALVARMIREGVIGKQIDKFDSATQVHEIPGKVRGEVKAEAKPVTPAPAPVEPAAASKILTASNVENTIGKRAQAGERINVRWDRWVGDGTVESVASNGDMTVRVESDNQSGKFSRVGKTIIVPQGVGRRLASVIEPETPAPKVLKAGNVNTTADVQGAQSSKPLGTQSEFSPKVAKQQKKFLLDAVDQAIAEAPEIRPRVEADPDMDALDSVRQFTARETRESFESRERDVIDRLVTKYDVPKTHPSYEGPMSQVAGVRAVGSFPAGEHGVNELARLVREAITRAIFQQSEKVTIEVPGDGTFEIINSKKALNDFKDRAAKFPTTAAKIKQSSQARTSATAAAPLGKPDRAGALAALAPSTAAASEEGRKILWNIWSDGKQSVATNGRVLAVVKIGLGGTAAKPILVTIEGKPAQLEKDAKFPDWNQVVPTNLAESMKNLDTEKLFTVLRQAQETTSDKAVSVKLWRNPDGSLGVTSNDVETGSYEHNVQGETSTVIMAIDPTYLINAINAARRVGDKTVSLEWMDELSPIKVSSENTFSIIMPMRLSAAPQQGASTVQQVTAEALSFLGVQQLPTSITVIDDPSKPFAAVITNRNTVTLNAAKIDPGTVGKVLLEEGLHGVWFTPEVQSVLAEARKSVTEADIDAERAKRSGLDTDEATLIEEATIAKIVNRSFWNRLLDALKRAFRRLLGIEINPNSYDGLREAAMNFLRGERGNLPGKRLVASNAVVVAPGVSPAYAITAHHGTPHEVDKFSTEKIGTGEGAQVYGYGLYFSQHPEVAQAYASRLGDATPESGIAWKNLIEALKKDGNLGFDTSREAADAIVSNPNWRTAWEMSPETAFAANQYLKLRGKQYTVTLNVDQDELLDWDKPLSEQSEKVRKALLQKPALSQSASHAETRNANALRDITEGKTFTNEGYSGLDIPTQRMVLDAMRGVLNNDEVFNAVVRFIPVDVVNILAGKQGSPKMLLQDPAMLFDLFASDGRYSVALRIERADSAIISIARVATEHILGSDVVGRGFGKNFSALRASEVHKTGSDFYSALVRELGSSKSASEFLAAQQISGIRYLDQGSRANLGYNVTLEPTVEAGREFLTFNVYARAKFLRSFTTRQDADAFIATDPAKFQTYNFVIFNSDDITITHRNGQPVALEEAMGDEVRYAAPTVESTTTSENEALNSKAFKANAELADDLGTIRPEDDEEGVRTKVGNVYDQVLSRPGLNNAVKADSVSNAQNALAEAGLVVAQADDGLFELVDSTAPQEQGGQSLVTILEREIQSARTENRPERIANLLNTVVVHLARDKNQAFSQATKNRLYALAQGERSAFGRALGSLAMWGKVLANVAMNPSLHLNRIYSQNLGGDEISEVMERLRKILGGSPTAQEIEDALAKIQAEFSKKNRMFEKGNKLWGKIQKAARAGLFDPGPILEDLARNQGWTVPTEGQKAWLRAQVAEEERLRTPTQRQIDNAGGDIDKATSEAAKGTESERLKIIKDIQAHWSRWSMPISWNPFKWTAQTMRNNARAVNEFVAANFLFTPGFPVRQWMDVVLTSLPLNAVNRTLVHVLERAQNDGGFSVDTTNDLYAASEEMLVSRIASLKATIRAMERTAGGHLNRKVLERMTHSVGVFERMRVKANELKSNGNLAGYWALRIASILQAGYRVASVFDESQATGLEWQEMRQQLATDLRAQGKSRAEISTQLDDILGGIRVDMVEAVAEVTAIKQERGLPLDKKSIEQDAWALIKARAYDRMRQATGTDAQYEAENTQLRELHSWNLPETGGIGGAIAGTINFIKRYTEKAGIPTGGLFSFGNAMGIAANRMATFSGGGLFGGFGFGDSPWYQGDRNIKQRRIEAIEGLAVMGLMVALAAAGKILIMTRYPDDKDEKERFIAEGHKLNTVRFIQDDGQWIEYPIQMSPFSFIASPLYMIGGIQRLLIDQQKAQERLNAEAAKTGATPGQAKAIGPGDVAGVIAQGMYGMLTGGRTATGAIQSFSDYGDFNLSRASSSLVRGYIPGVPAWQTVSRMMGVAMDSKTASVFEQLFPVPGSQHQRVNSLGDPMANANDAVRVLQVLTAGVGFGSEADQKSDYAYRQLASAGYAAPAIGRNKGHNFGGTLRPMNPREYGRYVEERGKAFKRELEQLGSLDGLGSGEARKAAQSAFQRANQRALASVGVSEIKPKRAYTRRLRTSGGITRRGRQPSLGRIRRGSNPSFGKLRPARAPRIKRTVLSGTRRQRVQRIVPANY